MRVAFVASEVHPFVKTGGLADVAAGLPSALAERGVATTVFVPLHREAGRWLAAHPPGGEAIGLERRVPIAGTEHSLAYRRLEWRGHRIVFVVHDGFFNRPHPYLDADGRDYADSVARWTFFCRAVLEYSGTVEAPPDIWHANDWQTALLPAYLKTHYRERAGAGSASLLTLHNLAYQGLFAKEQLVSTGLGWDVFHPNAFEFYDQLNLLKGGIAFADHLNAVSPSYAVEIQTEEHGKGLDGLLRARRDRLSGILNGIDATEWDPATDPHLPAHYAAGDMAGKAACKVALQRRFGLPAEARAFVCGVISRFDLQKGLPLIVEALTNSTDPGLQLVVLGAGDPRIQEAIAGLARAQPERVGLVEGFDEALAHLIEGGADAFLMPSAYEPCGLSQMYSQRYGTVPIVRETGGLKDTVVNVTAKRLAAGTASGFTFRAFGAAALWEAIGRGARLYRAEPAVWDTLRQAIMGLDHSWHHRADQYIDLYARMLARHDR